MTDMLKAALAAALALPASACAAALPAPAATAPAVAPTRFTVTVEGQGPDVILIPGLSTPRDVWDGARAALAGRYRVHLIQINGFGGTAAGANAGGSILPGTVAELQRYIEANRLQRPAVVGHSLGGLLALMLAEAAPERVGRVMVVDALPFIGALLGPGATVEAVRPQAEALRAMMQRPASPEQRAASAAQVAAGLAATPAARERVAAWVASADPQVAGQMTYEGFTTDASAQLGRIAAPVTVLYAWNEATLPEARARAVFEPAYAGVSRVRFEPVGGSGHFIMLDQPARFEALLRAFLEARD
jgi:pimeloyl-ACP methyl ester carboxylesterase